LKNEVLPLSLFPIGIQAKELESREYTKGGCQKKDKPAYFSESFLRLKG